MVATPLVFSVKVIRDPDPTEETEVPVTGVGLEVLGVAHDVANKKAAESVVTLGMKEPLTATVTMGEAGNAVGFKLEIVTEKK